MGKVDKWAEMSYNKEYDRRFECVKDYSDDYIDYEKEDDEGEYPLGLNPLREIEYLINGNGYGIENWWEIYNDFN